MKKLIPLLLLLLNCPLFGQETFQLNINFDKDEYIISNEEKLKLNLLLDSIETWDVTQIKLAGHTDNDASNAYNLLLSQNRVKTIASFLLNKNVADKLIARDFFGESKPASTNSNAEGMQRNRRVEITVLYNKPIKILAIKESIKLPDCSADTMIVLPAGTIYKINKCAFEANPNCVNISEFLDPASAEERGFETVTSSGASLVSGGMIEYDICEGIEVIAYIPLNAACSTFGMNLYELGEGGAWEIVSDETIKEVQINDRYYYEVPLSGMSTINMDKGIPPELLIKVKIKSKRGVELDYATISCDCQFFIFGNVPKNKRDRKIKIDLLCCPDPMISILARTTEGDTLIMERQSIENISNKSNRGYCPSQEIKKQWWFIKIFEKGIYRKYKVGLEDFQ
ncbi:MAG: OmpA family protein [Crocinitomix sp.]|nr:OmpA family protein [Crocinitomix sp.]